MPWIHARLSKLGNSTAKYQAFGALAIIGACLYFGVSWWIGQQLKPWGPGRAEVVAATSKDDDYLSQLSKSLDDWFAKRPMIRDALVFRLDELTKSCQQLIDEPPATVTGSSKERMLSALGSCVSRVGELKKLLTEKDKANDDRYKKTVAAGLEEADTIVRETQQKLKG